MGILSQLVTDYDKLKPLEENINKAVDILEGSFKQGNKLIVCGNGGSASDAMHIVGELMKSFVLARHIPEADKKQLTELFGLDGEYIAKGLQCALPAISLASETALLTAFGNDRGYDLAFAQQVYGYGKPNDVLLAISTSGNSKNVVYAAQTAVMKGLKVIAMTGENGGKLGNISHALINVSETQTYKIQELHLPIYHAVCLELERRFFGG